jgi:uncharacterized protein with PIN domain
MHRPHAPPGSPRFLVDGMALRLGKYLRCAGFDAVWDVAAETRALARRAELEGRILLTRNTRIGEGVPPPPRWLALASEDPCEQFHQVVRELDLDPRARLFTRCIRCNVELVPAAAMDVESRVPAAVRARYTRFFACPGCATVFWHGSHVANTCRKLGLEPPAP